jgi:hypothetical protein
MDILRALFRLRDVLDQVNSFAAALATNPALGDDLAMEIWQQIGEPVMPQLRPLPASVVSLDVPAFQGGPNLVELLEALPVNESILRARALEDHAALMDALDEARSRAALSPQEAQLWNLTRHERCSIGDAARRVGWSESQVHVVRSRMLKKVRVAGRFVTPCA